MSSISIRLSRSSAGARVIAMLVSRTLLFAAFQTLAAVILALSGQPQAWDASVAWWPVSVILSNLVGMWLLRGLYRAEGSHWLSIFRFPRATLGRDLLALLGFGILMGPLAMLPAQLLGDALFGGVAQAYTLFFHPLPAWAAVASLVLFPLTIALAELPTYCGYVQPRLERLNARPWLAWLLTAFFLAGQHIAMPLILDGRFILWRFLMFLPFALAITLLLRWRPRLLPYMMIFHGLLDLGTIWFVFALSFGIG